MSRLLDFGVSSYKTPFSYIFMFYKEDEEINEKRIKQIDMMISAILDYIDIFAHEYKWSEDHIKKLTPVKRQELIRRIVKRHEKGGGDNAFGT